MQSKYLIVDKALLPPYFEKVVQARELLDDGQARDVSEAVKMVGISRSTYYKYKDLVRNISTVSMGRHAIISMMISHKVGILSTVIGVIRQAALSVQSYIRAGNRPEGTTPHRLGYTIATPHQGHWGTEVHQILHQSTRTGEGLSNTATTRARSRSA